MEREASSEIFVSVVICRDVLFNSDRIPTLFSAITRIVSKPVKITGPAKGDTGEHAVLWVFRPAEIALFVSLSSAIEHKNVRLGVKVRTPIGEYWEPNEGGPTPVDLDAAQEGYFFNIKTPIDPQIEGLYWFEISVNDVLKNQTPLRIMHEFPEE